MKRGCDLLICFFKQKIAACRSSCMSIIAHKKADAFASAFAFQARSTAFVDDFLGAAFTGADDFAVSGRTLVDNLQ